ncbi:MAG: hypothetical protein KY468_01550 [Armatimonadetes bacterium]|nr:hypothetical protein [Armatimonadota bacterium]
MSFNYRVERESDEAHLFASGSLVAEHASEMFGQVTHLIQGGYQVHLHLEEVDFIGLGAVRALRTAAVRAEDAGVSLRLYAGSSLYRVADLVGPDRWAPLPVIAFEDDSIPV